MKSLLWVAVLAAASLAVSRPAEAYTEKGAGVSSCGRWLADHQDPRQWNLALNEESWVLGFLSAIPYAAQNFDPLRDIDNEGLSAWISNYCAARPIDEIGDAAKAFVRAHPR